MSTPEARRRRRLLGAGVGLLAGVLLVGVLTILVRTWSLTDTIRQAQKENDQVLAYIEDCTNPDGECFAQSEKRYANAVSGINAGTLRIIAAALACEADGVTERAELADCTAKRAERAALGGE